MESTVIMRICFSPMPNTAAIYLRLDPYFNRNYKMVHYQ